MILGIYGAGGLGREVLILAQQINKDQNRWEEITFIDDISELSIIKKTRVLSFDEISDYYNKNIIEISIAVGEPLGRKKLKEKIEDNKYNITTLIHPSIYISECTKIGKGSIICANSFISCDTIIGSNVLVLHNTIIGHDNSIGNNSVIAGSVAIGGECKIGGNTYIGLGAIVKEHTSIGDNTIIGMGSVVFRDVTDGVIALGNPARIIKRTEEMRVFKG